MFRWNEGKCDRMSIDGTIGFSIVMIFQRHELKTTDCRKIHQYNILVEYVYDAVLTVVDGKIVCFIYGK